jgi:hypothetical protein
MVLERSISMNLKVWARGTPRLTWTFAHSLALVALLLVLVVVEVKLPATARLLSWGCVMGLLLAFALVAGHGATGLWLGLLIDGRNKVSLSRLQMTLWTVVILSGFLTAVLSNIELGHPTPLSIHIPVELWLLMGISTTSLVGSPLLVEWKKQREVSAEEQERVLARLARQLRDLSGIAIQGQMVMNQTPQSAHWSDLFSGSETGSAGQLDLGKLQMFFFTLVTLLAYSLTLAAQFNEVTKPIRALPAPDAGMLALLVISHAGYLVNKALPTSNP